MTRRNQNFGPVFEGNAKILEIEILDENEDPQDLSGFDIHWKGTRVHGGTNVITKNLGTGISFSGGPSAGIILVELDPEDTDGYPGIYKHEVMVEDGYNDPQTVTEGKFNVVDSLFGA